MNEQLHWKREDAVLCFSAWSGCICQRMLKGWQHPTIAPSALPNFQSSCPCILPQAAGHATDAASWLVQGEHKQQMVPLGKDGTQCGKYSLHGPHRLLQPGEEVDSGYALEENFMTTLHQYGQRTKSWLIQYSLNHCFSCIKMHTKTYAKHWCKQPYPCNLKNAMRWSFFFLLNQIYLLKKYIF